MHLFHIFIFGMKPYMFQTVPLSIIRSFSLYLQQWYMSHRYVDSLRAGANALARKLPANLYDIYLLYVQWKTPDDGQRDCPNHVEFQSKNKFEKLVHLSWFYYKKFFCNSSEISLYQQKAWNGSYKCTYIQDCQYYPITVSYEQVVSRQMDDIRCGDLSMQVSSSCTYSFIHL